MEKINFNHQKLTKHHKQILSERLEVFAKDKNKGKPYEIALTDIHEKLIAIKQHGKSLKI